MTKEEILRAAYEAHVKKYPATNWMSWEEACADHSMDVALSAMEQYATAQTAELQKEVERLKKENERIMKHLQGFLDYPA